MIAAGAIFNQLAAVVGEAQILRSPDDLVRYDVDERQGGGNARAVVRPKTTGRYLHCCG